ncbi:MAG: RelA/SpoT family protein, partial [Parvularculaceae bacterium]
MSADPADADIAEADTLETVGADAASPPEGFIRQYELVDRVRAYDPNLDEDVLNRAYVFAMRAHGGQTRKSGDPYFTHPLAVAAILTELKADPASVSTALLHDVVEDTDATIDDIERLFGAEIARLVDGVTKLSRIELRSEASKQAENFRKLVMAMADDVRVLLVKLADRLHNMRTLGFFKDEEKRRRIALETMEIYAPLAGRIGVQRFREELEELSFRELNPQAYEMIKGRLADLQRDVVGSVVELAQTLRARLEEAGVACDVHSREKRPFSIWRKMSAKNVSFDELADIYAFRIITENVEDCYRALGVIHTTWRMIPSEFDDYVSATKPNNYRSIHTAVIGPPRPDGGRQQIEIQIRTREMHETAERGVAAHWRYKDKNAGGAKEKAGGASVDFAAPGFYDPYETPRRLVEMFQQGEDPDEALKYAKLELFQDQVFAFTPKGRVIALPRGATGLDFAYAVHTDIGDRCIGVKINGVSRPLRTPLKNGDVVLVLRSENAAPPAGWESMAVTGRARSAIRRRIKKMKRAQHVALGRAMADDVFADASLSLSPKALSAALGRLGEDDEEDVYARIGRGDLAVADLIEAVYPGAALEQEGELRAAGMTPLKPYRVIDGLPPGAEVALGRCCAPVPGVRIVGFREGVRGDGGRDEPVPAVTRRASGRREGDRDGCPDGEHRGRRVHVAVSTDEARPVVEHDPPVPEQLPEPHDAEQGDERGSHEVGRRRALRRDRRRHDDRSGVVRHPDPGDGQSRRAQCGEPETGDPQDTQDHHRIAWNAARRRHASHEQGEQPA